MSLTSQSMTNKLAVVTLHDAAPSFSKRIFEFTDAFESLGINFNVALVPFFHNEEEIRAGLEIFEQVGVKTSVFIPPQWKLNNSSIEVLQKLGFGLAEMQEEFFLLSYKPVRKIKVPKVLSWDLTGHPSQNVVRIGTEERRFELLDDARGRKMIRIAPHPRDPHKVFREQIDMIRELRDQDYTIPVYLDLVQNLQDAPYTTIL